MSEPPHHKVLIIGSGPAGLTAAIYAARANLSPTCVEGFNAGGLIPGGQLMFTTDVENFPGFPEKVSGQELMIRFREQAERQGTELVTADAQRVDLSTRPFKVWVGEDENVLHLADSIIIATGARANYVGLQSEDLLKNKGVSACAVCDGALFRNQDVVVVGGGDTAMEEATYLAGLCKSVTLVHRRDEFRASKSMQHRVKQNPKIRILYSHAVVEVLDPALDKVVGVRVKDLKIGRRTDGGLRRHVRRHRTHAHDGALQGPARHPREWVSGREARHDSNQRGGRVRCGGRGGLDVSSGGDGGRYGVHGRARSGAVARRARVISRATTLYPSPFVPCAGAPLADRSRRRAWRRESGAGTQGGTWA